MDWSWIVVTLAVPALLAGAWWGWRARRARDVPPLAAHDRFTPVAALSDVQMALMQYLVEAFAGRPVLFRAPLSQLVAPRGAGDRLQTQRRLAQHHVDFVVCNRAGKPLYAFELDAAHDSAEQAEHDAAEKHLILKAAGIRLIRIKRSTREMPSPREFRQRLGRALGQGLAHARLIGEDAARVNRIHPGVGIAPVTLIDLRQEAGRQLGGHVGAVDRKERLEQAFVHLGIM